MRLAGQTSKPHSPSTLPTKNRPPRRFNRLMPPPHLHQNLN